MHTVRKEYSTTSKVRVVFDVSAKSSSGTLLNNQLLVGPTVHSSLVNVLLRFRRHTVALATDVRWMYRAVLLPKTHLLIKKWRITKSGPAMSGPAGPSEPPLILIYRISSIKLLPLINGRPPIHARRLHSCTQINAGSPIHAGIMRGGCGKHSTRPHTCYGVS